MYPDHSLDVNILDSILLHILLVKSRLYQVNTRNIPLLIGFTLLQSDVSTSLQLCNQFMHRLIANRKRMSFNAVIHRLQVVQLFDFILPVHPQLLDDLGLLVLIIFKNLKVQICYILSK